MSNSCHDKVGQFCSTEGGGGSAALESAAAEAVSDLALDPSNMTGFCGAATIYTWEKLGKPKDLVPYNVSHPDRPNEGHVLLFNKKTGTIVDPAGAQFDPRAPLVTTKAATPYRDFRKVGPGGLEMGREMMNERYDFIHPEGPEPFRAAANSCHDQAGQFCATGGGGDASGGQTDFGHSRSSSGEDQAKHANTPTGTIVSRSKKGHVEVAKVGKDTKFMARTKSGENLGHYNSIYNAQRAVENPKASRERTGRWDQPSVSWRAAEEHEMPQVTRFLAHLGGEIRTATYEGREHLVVPIIALVEGVIFASNADVPELVLLDDMARSYQGWDGRPVMMNHPDFRGEKVSANSPTILEERSFGRVFNARIDGNKLKMDAYLDPEKAKRVGPEAEKAIARIRAGEKVEVSVGAFVVTEPRAGVWAGKRYAAIWREIVSDHLAILPEGARGACSFEAGCGVRAAEANAEGLRDAANSCHDKNGQFCSTGGGGGAAGGGEAEDAMRMGSDPSHPEAAAAIAEGREVENKQFEHLASVRTDPSRKNPMTREEFIKDQVELENTSISQLRSSAIWARRDLMHGREALDRGDIPAAKNHFKEGWRQHGIGLQRAQNLGLEPPPTPKMRTREEWKSAKIPKKGWKFNMAQRSAANSCHDKNGQFCETGGGGGGGGAAGGGNGGGDREDQILSDIKQNAPKWDNQTLKWKSDAAHQQISMMHSQISTGSSALGYGKIPPNEIEGMKKSLAKVQEQAWALDQEIITRRQAGKWRTKKGSYTGELVPSSKSYHRLSAHGNEEDAMFKMDRIRALLRSSKVVKGNGVVSALMAASEDELEALEQSAEEGDLGEPWYTRFLGVFRKAAEGVSDKDVRRCLEDSLRGSPGFIGVDSVFPKESKVVYAIMTGESTKFLRRGYSMVDGKAEMSDDEEEVHPVTRFEAVAAARGLSGKTETQSTNTEVPEMDPKKAARIKALISSGQTCFTEEDTETLAAMPDDRFAALEARVESKLKAASAPAPAAPAAPAAETEEEYLAKAPASIRDAVNGYRAAEQKRHGELLTAAKAIKQDVYSQAELEKMDSVQLDKVIRLASAAPQSPVDQSGRLVPRAAASVEDDGVPQPISMIDRLKARK